MELIRKNIFKCKKCSSVWRTPYLHCRQNSQVSSAPDQKKPMSIVSGVQPTGVLHIGNYFGAVRRCVQLQNEGHRVKLFVADLHALTVLPDGPALRTRTLDTAAMLLASGIDPDKTTLWIQSWVSRHAELCWVLSCGATLARLQQLPQFKERESVGEQCAGSLLYPVLQAADVLSFGADAVAAGADQAVHVQLATHLAKTANTRFGKKVFVEPVHLPPTDECSERIRSLRDPTKKMSKSDASERSRILLTDSDDVIRRKIRRAVTDFTPEVTWDPEGRPGVSNLVRIHCLSAGLVPEEAVEQAELTTTAMYKEVVSSTLISVLSPIRERYFSIRNDEANLRDILLCGADRARELADRTWARVVKATGVGDLGEQRVVDKVKISR